MRKSNPKQGRLDSSITASATITDLNGNDLSVTNILIQSSNDAQVVGLIAFQRDAVGSLQNASADAIQAAADKRTAKAQARNTIITLTDLQGRVVELEAQMTRLLECYPFCTPTPTRTPSVSPSRSIAPSSSHIPPTPTRTPVFEITPTRTATPTVTPMVTPTPTRTVTPTPTQSPT